MYTFYKLNGRDLEKPMYEGGVNYRLLRDGYLSLEKSDILGLIKLFPGYNYFFTEINHRLDYPVFYKNKSFIIYNINIKN